jgi:hypothetical protein
MLEGVTRHIDPLPDGRIGCHGEVNHRTSQIVPQDRGQHLFKQSVDILDLVRFHYLLRGQLR